MTNEEIEKAVNDLHLDSICRDDFDPEDVTTVRSDIAEAMRSLVSRAYEEVARAQCVDCQYNAPCYLERGRWKHPEGECRASTTRTLQGQLRFGRSTIERLLPLQDELNKAGMLK